MVGVPTKSDRLRPARARRGRTHITMTNVPDAAAEPNTSAPKHGARRGLEQRTVRRGPGQVRGRPGHPRSVELPIRCAAGAAVAEEPSRTARAGRLPQPQPRPEDDPTRLTRADHVPLFPARSGLHGPCVQPKAPVSDRVDAAKETGIDTRSARRRACRRRTLVHLAGFALVAPLMAGCALHCTPRPRCNGRAATPSAHQGQRAPRQQRSVMVGLGTTNAISASWATTSSPKQHEGTDRLLGFAGQQPQLFFSRFRQRYQQQHHLAGRNNLVDAGLP